jgi:hypothetical protein
VRRLEGQPHAADRELALLGDVAWIGIRHHGKRESRIAVDLVDGAQKHLDVVAHAPGQLGLERDGLEKPA